MIFEAAIISMMICQIQAQQGSDMSDSDYRTYAEHHGRVGEQYGEAAAKGCLNGGVAGGVATGSAAGAAVGCAAAAAGNVAQQAAFGK